MNNTTKQNIKDRNLAAAYNCTTLIGKAIGLALNPPANCGAKDYKRHIKFATHSKLIDHYADIIELDAKRIKDKIIQININLLTNN